MGKWDDGGALCRSDCGVSERSFRGLGRKRIFAENRRAANCLFRAVCGAARLRRVRCALRRCAAGGAVSRLPRGPRGRYSMSFSGLPLL